MQGRTIRISRGDSGLLRLNVAGAALDEGDRAVFTVKRRGGGTAIEKVIRPKENAFDVPLLPEETGRMPAGTYEWDVRIVLSAKEDETGRVTDGREVITPIPPSPFLVMKVVGSV